MVESSSAPKIREVLMEGLLTKSPPTRDESPHSGSFLRDLHCLGMAPRFLRKQWRQRYCVLYKVRGGRKTEIYFDYYKDANHTKLKGRVDLCNCECIVDNVEIGKWSNVFSIQTLHKNRSRTYYFAAETQDLMCKWVRILVDVTRLGPNFSDLGYSTLKSIPSINARKSPFARSLGVSSLSAIRPTGNINHTWLHEICHPLLEPRTMNDSPTHGDDSYHDPGAPEVYYSPNGLGDELDEYHMLPGCHHSYVNLKRLGGSNDMVSADQEHATTRTSCPNLTQDAPPLPGKCAHLGKTQTLFAPPRPARERGLSLNKSGDAVNATSIRSNAPDRRRNSNNSVYFNMWEAMDGDDYLLAPPLAPKPNPNQSASPTIHTKGSQGVTSNSRIYRRSQLIYNDSQFRVPSTQILPSASQPSFTTASPVVQNEVRGLPVGKPIPPPRASTTVISTTCTPIQPGYPTSPDQILRTLSIEACNDLELPKRAPAVGNIADSSMESDSDTSVSPIVDVVKDQMDQSATLKPPDHSVNQSGLSTPNGTNVTTKLPTEAVSKTDVTHGDPIKPVSQPHLNYIEPCNLELGSNLSTTVPTRNVSGPTTYNNLNCGTTADSGSAGGLLNKTTRSNPPDDDRIEYKEIDPISTNALAIVTKHYLDDDTCPR